MTGKVSALQSYVCSLAQRGAHVDSQDLRVTRVLSNNAVVARAGGSERVVVGRGIGFGCKAGDLIAAETVQRSYIELSSQRAHVLEVLQDVDPNTLETISNAVDLAGDLLGTLHPSVYLLLSDHLVFSLQRLSEGKTIENPLSAEIKAVFPDEYGAGLLVLQYINSHIEVELPADEAAFIALHLKAARLGVAVKKPLEQANELASLVKDVSVLLGYRTDDHHIDNELFSYLARLIKRVRNGEFRTLSAQRSIERDLGDEMIVATSVMCRLMGVDTLPRIALGETAFLAVFLHGWKQNADVCKPQ